MLNKRIVTGFMSIAGALAIAGGATFAYFTDTASSPNNQFTSGKMEIAVDQSSTMTHETASPITNWQPGEEKFVRFDVVNNGTLPVNLQGAAFGKWGNGTNPDLLPEMVKVVKAEYWNDTNGTWRVITSNPNGFEGVLYYAPDNNLGNLQVLQPSQREQFRLTVKLDETADNLYEDRTYNATVQIQAKQVNAPDWTVTP